MQGAKKDNFSFAVNAQGISATFKDRLKRVGCHVRRATGKEKERLKTLSSPVKAGGRMLAPEQVHANGK